MSWEWIEAWGPLQWASPGSNPPSCKSGSCGENESLQDLKLPGDRVSGFRAGNHPQRADLLATHHPIVPLDAGLPLNQAATKPKRPQHPSPLEGITRLRVELVP